LPSKSKPTKGRKGWGGKREGAGRKRDRFPPEIIERLGPPPHDKPLALIRWYQRALAEAAWLLINGEGGTEFRQELRSLALAATRAIPADILYAAEKKVREEDEDRDADDGPDTEELADGDDGASRPVACDPS